MITSVYSLSACFFRPQFNAVSTFRA